MQGQHGCNEAGFEYSQHVKESDWLWRVWCCLEKTAAVLMLFFFWQLIYSWRASITTASSPTVTFPFLANRTRTISKRPWKPCILWASPMMKSYVSIHETNLLLLHCICTAVLYMHTSKSSEMGITHLFAFTVAFKLVSEFTVQESHIVSPLMSW